MARHLLRCWSDVLPLLQKARGVRLFLDFDGTLARLARRPEDVAVDQATHRALERLTRCRSVRVTIVSGRRRSDLVARVRLARVQYWGLFGWETRPGRSLPGDARRAVARTRARLGALLDRIPGVYIEDKQWALAVHTRDASASARHRASAALRGYLSRPGSGMYAILGAQSWNVLPRQIPGKGHAVGQAIARLRPAVLPIYVGDDGTDEPAFAAIGHGVAVHVGSPRRTRAEYYLSDPGEVRRFLERLDGGLRCSAPSGRFNSSPPRT